MKASELEGSALEYWMLRAMENKDFEGITFDEFVEGWFWPILGWSEVGPIIERQHIELRRDGLAWAAIARPDMRDPLACRMTGATALVAAMRCYVASKFGEELPE